MMYLDNFTLMGLLLRESATGKLVQTAYQGQDPTALVYTFRRNSSPTAFVSSAATGALMPASPMFLRITYDGTTYTFYTSMDGLNWTGQLAEAKAAFFTTAPDQVGFFIWNSCGTPVGASIISWVQT